KSAELRGLREATVAFTISYQGREPTTVALVANTLASFYNEANMKARERQASSTAEFLKAQLAETKKRLDEQEERVSGFKRRHLGELPQRRQTGGRGRGAREGVRRRQSARAQACGEPDHGGGIFATAPARLARHAVCAPAEGGAQRGADRAQGPQNRRRSSPRGYRDLPATSRQRPATGTGVQRTLARLRKHS